MSEEKSKFFCYKGKPLVRCGDTLYYGDMRDKYVIKLEIKSKQKSGNLELADKVSVKLMNTDPDVSPRKAIIKTSEKPNLYLAIDIANVWLKKSLKEAQKEQSI